MTTTRLETPTSEKPRGTLGSRYGAWVVAVGDDDEGGSREKSDGRRCDTGRHTDAPPTRFFASASVQTSLAVSSAPSHMSAYLEEHRRDAEHTCPVEASQKFAARALRRPPRGAELAHVGWDGPETPRYP